MAINEQGRQLEVAREAEEFLRTLAHSTRDVLRTAPTSRVKTAEPRAAPE